MKEDQEIIKDYAQLQITGISQQNRPVSGIK